MSDNLRERQKRATRKALVEAFRDSVASIGYDRTSIGSIISAANVSRGTFYFHFANKADIATSLIDELHDGAADVLDVPLTLDSSRVEVADALRRLVRYYRTEIAGFVAWRAVVGADPQLDRPIGISSSRFTRALVRGAEQIADDVRREVDLLLWLMYGQLDQICFAAFASDWPADEARLVDRLTELWFDHFFPRLRELVGPVS